jgi:hypothetical protein
MTADAGTSPSNTCPDCGAVVADPALHRTWHTELPRAISQAVIQYVDTHRG